MKLNIGGLTPLTSNDFPGKWAAVLFLQGCPWRCRYCHNPHLWKSGPSQISWEEVLTFLNKRQGLLDAVVFSGGEPTMQTSLAEAMTAVRELGFEIGLHTSGVHPHRLKTLLPLIDWVGFDFKAPLGKYESITQRKTAEKNIETSAKLIIESGKSYEFRSTVHPTLHSPEDLHSMAKYLKDLGATHYVLQQFRTTGCQDEALNQNAQHDFPSPETLAQIEQMFPHFTYRGP